MCSTDIFLGLLAILFPPLAVWVKRGICSADSLINICLCCLGFIPGLLHAWYIIAKYPDNYEIHYVQIEGGRRGQPSPWSHQYSAPRSHHQGAHPQLSQPQNQQPARNYGTAGPSANAANQPRIEDNNAGEGPASGEGPPSYSEVVKGDFKVQNQE